MESKLCQVSFGTAAAALSALSVIVVSIFAYFGYYKEAVEIMAKHHMFFTFTPIGVILGALTAGVKGFIYGYVFAWFYNHCPFNK